MRFQTGTAWDSIISEVMMISSISVDWTNGERKCSSRCPVANAMLKTFGLSYVSISPDFILCTKEGRIYQVETSSRLRLAIQRYDKGTTPKNSEYDIQMSEGVAKILGGDASVEATRR